LLPGPQERQLQPVLLPLRPAGRPRNRQALRRLHGQRGGPRGRRPQTQGPVAA
ncbi:hypothetical protein MNEG_3256, partial [Monoraphidium neglectum]